MDCAGLWPRAFEMWGRAVACFLTVGLLVFFGAGCAEIFSLQVEMMRSTRWVIWQISVQDPFISSRKSLKQMVRTFLARR